jgi:preprotein translocase subunit SecA
MNKQRQAFYARRLTAMSADDETLREEIEACIEGFVANLIDQVWPQRGDPEDDEYVEISHALEAQFGIALSIEAPPFRTPEGNRPGDRDALGHSILECLASALVEKKEEGKVLKEETYAGIDAYPTFDRIVRDLQLQILDQQWKAHLHTMDALRESINLRGYAQRDPKIEYQREGFGLFGEMEQRIDDSFAEYVFKFGYPRPNLGPTATARRVDGGQPASPRADAAREASPSAAGAAASGAAAVSSTAVKVGRNDPCPCGSGKKHKKCCGA